MKKLESTLPNMFIVLTLIALVSAAALAFTYDRTAPILAEQARQRQIAAIAEVVPEFDNVPTDEAYSADGHPGVELYPATRGGTRVGTAVRAVSPDGYGGNIAVMVGFDDEGRITGTTVLSHTETPGLGARVTEDEFREQFVGAEPGADAVEVVQDGGTIDALTAATITSRAFCDAVQRAWSALEAAGGSNQ